MPSLKAVLPRLTKPLCWIAGLVIALGAFFQLWVYSHHQSFWKDEVGLARNFPIHDLAHIGEPFHEAQAAPIGFCQLSKIAEMTLGHSEHAFWLLPLVLGILLLFAAAFINGKLWL